MKATADYAEGVAAVGVVGGDFVGPDAGAVPAHAMRQASGRQADLRIFEAFAALAQHLVGGNPQIVDADGGVAARHGAVDGVGHAFDGDGRIGQIDQEQAGALLRLGHDNADLGALRAGDEGLAAIDHPVVAIGPGRRQHHGRIRACAAIDRRFGHEEGGAGFA